MNDLAELAKTSFTAPVSTFTKTIIELVEALRVPTSAQARWHPLGFMHFAIMTSSNQGLRLHIWPSFMRKTQSPSYPIHDHSFVLSSRVIIGKMMNTTYSITASPEGSHAIYEVEYQSGTSILRKSNRRCNLAIDHREEHRTHSSYNVKRGIFHKSEASRQQCAATLVVTSDLTNSPPLVLGDSHGPREVIYVREECSLEDRHTALNELASSIEAGRNRGQQQQ